MSVQSINTFGYSLLSSLRTAGPNNTVFVSPLSIFFALSMVSNGATDMTLQQFIHVLHLSQIDKKTTNPSSLGEFNKELQKISSDLANVKDIDVKIANSLWVKENHPIKENFTQLIKQAYGGEARLLKPSGKEDINNWVSEKTEGKIKELIKSIENVEVIIVNAIYFKGLFKYPFDQKKTRKGPFYLSNGQRSEVDFMQQTGHISYLETDKFSAVNFPYTGEMIATVVLPNTNINPNALNNEFSAGRLDVNKFGTKMIEFFLPKFKIEWDRSLKEDLIRLGLDRAFSDSAEFSEMSTHPDGLKIGDVVHKTFVEVNEKGTEAAAATAVMMTLCASVNAPTPLRFQVNRPFYFFIRTKSGLLLFGGFIESV